MSLRRAVLAIAAKDLRIEWRHRTAFTSAIVFAVLVLVVFIFARDEGSVSLAALAPTVLWVMLALATVVTLNRAFLLEREHHALEGILLAPISPVALFWGKWLANLALVLVVELVAIPLWVLFFNITPDLRILGTGAVAILAAIGFTAPGTLFSAIAVRTRFAELLLPVLLLPFVIPPLFFAAQATVRLLEGAPVSDLIGWLRLLALYDIAFLALASILFPAVMDQ
ncbi:MAG TPA: heme exporter protein CcmB [Gemmatimonadales bacterium]|jgi:heme exporter protein B